MSDVDEGETENPPKSQAADADTVVRSSESTLTNPSSSYLFSHFTPASAAPVTLGGQQSNSTATEQRHHLPIRSMARTKHVRQKKRARGEEPDERVDSPARARAGRSTKNARDTENSESEIPPVNVLGQRAAAFPSLEVNAPPPPSTQMSDMEGHGMKELLEAIEETDDEDDSERVLQIHTQFEQLYAASTEAYYVALRGRWSPNESDSTVSFESLWPSLRQTIIEQIQEDFVNTNRVDTWYPVQCILRLTRERLAWIIKKNSEPWSTFKDIPEYFRELRRKYPDAILDPEEAPPEQVVRAIKFLKQQRLPVTLLGEHVTLPSKEAFAEYHEEERYHGYIVTAIEAEESSEAIVEQLNREYDARVLEMRVRNDTAPHNLPVRERVCEACNKKGHLSYDYDHEGLLVCPALRPKSWRERAADIHYNAGLNDQIANLHEEAELELAEIRRNDALLAAAPAQQDPPSPTYTGPTDDQTQPLHEAWQKSSIHQAWQNSQDLNARMTNSAFQRMGAARHDDIVYEYIAYTMGYSFTEEGLDANTRNPRDEYIADMQRRADEHPGLRSNNTPPQHVNGRNTTPQHVNGRNNTPQHANGSGSSSSGVRKQKSSTRTTTPARCSAAADALITHLNTMVSLDLNYYSGPFPMQPQKKKRKPYTRKPKPSNNTLVAGTFSATPPRKQITKNGLVSLAPPTTKGSQASASSISGPSASGPASSSVAGPSGARSTTPVTTPRASTPITTPVSPHTPDTPDSHLSSISDGEHIPTEYYSDSTTYTTDNDDMDLSGDTTDEESDMGTL
ncbi:hypothetical protein GMOD_00000056 [Pyrenophora seminiperda CCB06]|uniref:Uncharacterized protein n=1 Tax=Pyrenophora seminiperda CCB06 TaxID=1302712 RepID=A0A3M7M6A5_9PLEO|nr:hypothetical protein GMOD_00000056 [Pyrenophora seminiperda CCB06]